MPVVPPRGSPLVYTRRLSGKPFIVGVDAQPTCSAVTIYAGARSDRKVARGSPYDARTRQTTGP